MVRGPVEVYISYIVGGPQTRYTATKPINIGRNRCPTRYKTRYRPLQTATDPLQISSELGVWDFLWNLVVGHWRFRALPGLIPPFYPQGRKG
jgi:hypothetical protein